MIAERRRFRNESNIGLNINKSAEITQNGTRKKHFIACREHIRCLWGRLFAKIVLYDVLRGTYVVKDEYVENTRGSRFHFDSYSAIWLAYKV